LFKIGLDIGYGHCKIVSEKGSKICFPSLAKQGEKLDIDKLLGASEDYISTVNGTTWYVGKMAAKENRFAVRAFDENKRFDNPAFQAMLATSLAVASDGGEDILLVTGLPLSSYQDSKDEFKEFLEDFTAEVEIKDRQKTVSIKEAFVFPQAAGIFLNPYCEYIKSSITPESLVTVIDIGYRTTDVATFEYSDPTFNLLLEKSFTIDTGISDIFRELSEVIAKDVKTLEVTPESAERVFKTGFCYSQNKKIDYQEKIDVITHKTAAAIVEAFNFKGPAEKARSNSIILAGGGSIALNKDLLLSFPEAIVIQDAQFANAVGFLEVAKKIDVPVF